MKEKRISERKEEKKKRKKERRKKEEKKREEGEGRPVLVNNPGASRLLGYLTS